MIEFEIPGEPIGKGRPRFVRATGRVYTPEKTAVYENLVKLKYIEAGGTRFGDDDKIAIKLVAYFSIPKSASKKRAEEMRQGLILPTKKPDCDNILKIIDALNGIAWRDDAQIVAAEVFKYYSDEPKLKILITRI